MKKFIRYGLLGLISILLLSSALTTLARTPYYSYFVDSNGDYTDAPDLFVPSHQIVFNFDLATGMHVSQDSDDIFVSLKDSVLHFKSDGSLVKEIGKGHLVDARDVFVKNNQIYVADNGLKEIVVFDLSGQHIKSHGRPDGQIFGAQTRFNPISVVVDNTGNIYIVSEQTSEGVIQLSSNGNFTGFVGVNDTYKSRVRKIQEVMFPDDFVNQLSPIVPATINKVSIDQRGLIYTITSGSSATPIKKLNVAGGNILQNQPSQDRNVKDLSVGLDGNLYILYDEYGMIEVSDNNGTAFAAFGSKTDTVVRDGLLRTPIAIGVDGQSQVYILDPALGAIQVFRPTQMMSDVLKAMILFNDGLYDQAQTIWEQILNVNHSVALAHRSIGMAHFKAGEFDEALASFKLANDKANYSEAFWEIRQAWLLSNMQYVLLSLIILVVVYKILKWCYKRFLKLKAQPYLKRLNNHQRILDLKNLKKVLFKPHDVFYDISKGYIKLSSGLFLFCLLLISYTLSIYLKGYLFSEIDANFSIINSVSKMVLTVILYVVANYLVCSIRDGQGTKKAVFVSTMYALAPYMILIVPLSLITQVITYNERFIYDFILMLIYSYSGILLLIALMEVHKYSFKFTLNNILTIAITMIIILIFTITFIVLSTEFINFISSILREVLLRG